MGTQGNQADLVVLAQFDLKLITGAETELSSVGTANHQVAVELNTGSEAELAAGGATVSIAGVELNALSIEQGLIESGEVKALRPIFLGADVSGGPNEIGLGDLTQLLDFGQEIGAGERFGEGRHGF